MKAIIIFLISLVQYTKSNGITDLGECQRVFCQSMLDRHNLYRAQHGVGNLQIDQTISTSAQKWSENLAQLRLLVHSNNGKYGENLAMYGASNLAATAENCKCIYSKFLNLILI